MRVTLCAFHRNIVQLQYMSAIFGIVLPHMNMLSMVVNYQKATPPLPRLPLAICGLPRILEKVIDHHGYCSLISIAPTKFTSLYYGVSMTPLPLTNLYFHYA